MSVSQKEYSKMTQKASPNSKLFSNCVKAFFVGGTICTLGQTLTTLYTMCNIPLKDARAITSVSLIFLGALLTSCGIYDKISKIGGAGTLVPITGFANAVVAPCIEFKTEGYVIGLGAKMFIIAGPVIVYGVIASAIWGVICYLINTLTGQVLL